MCVMMYSWRSEGTLQEFSSFTLWVLGVRHRCSGLAASKQSPGVCSQLGVCFKQNGKGC